VTSYHVSFQHKGLTCTTDGRDTGDADQELAGGGMPAEQAARRSLPVPDIIARIKDGYPDLRPAEQSVADAILSDVQAAVGASNADIAIRAGVSQPTVTRFCRAIGCEGVRDFKLQLARSLVVGDLYLAADASPADRSDATPATPSDAALPPFWDSVLSEARAAIQVVERQLDPALLMQAAGLLAQSRGRVFALGLGGSSSSLAEETQNRLFRYGLGVTALKDPYLARMMVATCRPGDAFVAISSTGRTREVIEAVEMARHHRAATIAITTPGSDLARAADVALTVAVPEYPDTLKPSASRFAFLAVIDLMAAATGYTIGPPARENLRRIKYAIQTHRRGAALEPLGD
jgi:DNA-binding MurR/RpiR family transcriptional regulator